MLIGYGGRVSTTAHQSIRGTHWQGPLRWGNWSKGEKTSTASSSSQSRTRHQPGKWWTNSFLQVMVWRDVHMHGAMEEQTLRYGSMCRLISQISSGSGGWLEGTSSPDDTNQVLHPGFENEPGPLPPQGSLPAHSPSCQNQHPTIHAALGGAGLSGGGSAGSFGITGIP